jgi:hypothetical protein
MSRSLTLFTPQMRPDFGWKVRPTPYRSTDRTRFPIQK